jgi:hypothetical protein
MRGLMYLSYRVEFTVMPVTKAVHETDQEEVTCSAKDQTSQELAT